MSIVFTCIGSMYMYMIACAVDKTACNTYVYVIYGRYTADSLRCVHTESLGRADAVQYHTHIHTGKVN